MVKKKSHDGRIFNFADQSVTRSKSWKLMLDIISPEIRSNFVDVRETEQFPRKMVN